MAEAGKTWGVNPHMSAVLEDVQNRAEWAQIDAEILKRRLRKRLKVRTKPYRGAPNFVVPIVDDVTREKTDQEITMVMNLPLRAHMIPLQAGVSTELLRRRELAFDTFLIHILKLRAKLEEGMDTKNVRGLGVFKLLRRDDVRWGTVPDVEAMDPRDLIVPYNTRDVQEAERVTCVLRLSPREMKERARLREWRHVEEVIEAAQKQDRDTPRTSEEDALAVTASLIGITTSGLHAKTVVVWEVYHYAEAWDVEQDETGALREGERCVAVFSPDAPELPLMVYPWMEPDRVQVQEMAQPDGTTIVVEEEQRGAELPWPFVAGRFENRSRFWYDTRGIGHLCMDDQIAATVATNQKATMGEYYQTPLLEAQPGARNSENVTFAPGSTLPEGVKFASMPSVPPQFDYDIEGAKRTAGRRAGAVGLYEYSAELGERRKVQKTAREVQEESSRGSMVSSASVDRFNDPLSELYQQLWDDLARLRTPLPLIAHAEFAGLLRPDELYAESMLVVSAVSAKALHPERQFAQGREVLSFLMGFKDFVPIEVGEALRDLLAYWDPMRADRWLGKQSGQAPIYQQLQGLQAQISQLAQAVSGVNDQVVENDRVLAMVAQMTQRLEKMQAGRGGGNGGGGNADRVAGALEGVAGAPAPA